MQPARLHGRPGPLGSRGGAAGDRGCRIGRYCSSRTTRTSRTSAAHPPAGPELRRGGRARPATAAWSWRWRVQHDLILLDLVLPGIGGLEVCQRLRRERNHTPILMLTSKSAELDRVLGLEHRRGRLPDQAVQHPRAARAGQGAAAPAGAVPARRDAARLVADPAGPARRSVERRPGRGRGRGGGAHRQGVRPATCTSPATPAASSRARSCWTASGATITTATSTP